MTSHDTDNAVENAIRAGHAAALTNKTEDDNPYAESKLKLRCAWFAGFRDQKRGYCYE